MCRATPWGGLGRGKPRPYKTRGMFGCGSAALRYRPAISQSPQPSPRGRRSAVAEEGARGKRADGSRSLEVLSPLPSRKRAAAKVLLPCSRLPSPLAGEGGPLPALSPAGAGRVRGHFAWRSHRARRAEEAADLPDRSALHLLSSSPSFLITTFIFINIMERRL